MTVAQITDKIFPLLHFFIGSMWHMCECECVDSNWLRTFFWDCERRNDFFCSVPLSLSFLCAILDGIR